MRAFSSSIPAAAGLLLAAAATAALAAGTNELVSVGLGGAQSDGNCDSPALSADGRFVAFGSLATNLVPNDTNTVRDVFVRDRLKGTTERVSVSSSGAQADVDSDFPALSADGRYVAFFSLATNLVQGATSGTGNIYLRDLKAGTTELLSVGLHGEEGDGFSIDPSISADGRFVAFKSGATNLVPGDTNGAPDAFVRDRLKGKTERVNVGPHGRQPDHGVFEHVAISASGRFVAFDSYATNLVPGDTNGTIDVFVHDRLTDKTERVSVGAGGAQAKGNSAFPMLSAGGRYVVFDSDATNLADGDTNGLDDFYVHDRVTGATERVSVSSTGVQGDRSVDAFPSISGNGRFVTFTTAAGTLVPHDTGYLDDVFLRDLKKGLTRRVNVGPGGVQANGPSGDFGLLVTQAISPDGNVVAFTSGATNLAPGKTDFNNDILVRVLHGGS